MKRIFCFLLIGGLFTGISGFTNKTEAGLSKSKKTALKKFRREVYRYGPDDCGQTLVVTVDCNDGNITTCDPDRMQAAADAYADMRWDGICFF